MNSALQVTAYASADFSASDADVLNRLQEVCREFGCEPSSNDLLLDLGCGPGNIAERLHRQWPTTRVIGLDGAEAMLERARARQQGCPGSGALLQYRKAGLAELAADGWSAVQDCSSSQAAVVVSNSLLHHLHHPDQLWRATLKLACGGSPP